MKKILLLSDTHGYMDEQILKHAEKADEVWHAGDIGSLDVTDALKTKSKLRAVYGNIDDGQIRREFPEALKFNCNGINVWITHIGGYPPKYNNRTKTAISLDPPDLFICGHSHILKVMPDKQLKLLHMNPGAIGKHGFHKVRTMLRFKIDNAEIKDLEVIEYPK